MKNFVIFAALLLSAALFVATVTPARASRSNAGDRDGRPGAKSLHETPWEKWKNRHDADNSSVDHADGPRPWERRRKETREHSRFPRHGKRYPPLSGQQDSVWEEGHWNEREQWVPGYWKPRTAVAGFIWVPGEWNGSAWVRGFWRVAKKPGYIWVEGFLDETGAWHAGQWRKRK